MVAAALGAGVAEVRGETLARLPSTLTPPGPGPPVTSSAFPLELRFPGRISSSERVLVDVGPSGAPLAVRVRQRLVVRGKGDYSLSVRAPVLGVSRAPGSESEPGGRTGLVLWQGFSPGRRVLAADVRLRAAAAAPLLPLRIDVRRAANGRREVVLSNVTAVAADERSFTGRVRPSDAAAALDALRASLRSGRPAGDRFVRVDGLEPGPRLRTEIPLRVSGTLRAGGRATPFSRVLRSDRPLALPVPAQGAVLLSVTATPVAPADDLRPPGGRSWSAAAKTGRLRARTLLRLALRTRLAAARHRQYSQFLANPDRLGEARAVYVFRSRVANAAGPARASGSNDVASPVLAAILALTGVATALGLVVWWAHS